MAIKNSDNKHSIYSSSLEGRRFGRWTVLDRYIITDNNEKKYLCRCDCGTERYVLERSLRSGNSQSCGCLRKEKQMESISYDLSGQTFGELTVLRRSDNQNRNGGIWWLCKCSCGKEYEVPATLLITGKRTHCGCQLQRKPSYKDITGVKFDRLTALYPTDKRDSKGSVMWHCRCDCGNELDVSYNVLNYTNVCSCGCRKKEHDNKLQKSLKHVAGTSIDMLKSEKIPSNNTTGIKGVYFVRGKYIAKIVFQKKQYFLGTYATIEEAAEARHEGEKLINNVVVDYYEKWMERAKKDPQWADANPVKITVERDKSGSFYVHCFPELSSDK